MVYKPRTTEEVYNSLRDGLTSRANKLTNFVETSFNYIWTQAFSQRFRDNEVALLASQLSGWIDYAGGPITEEDLEELDVTGVDPEDVNQYMSDEDLDNLAEIIGVSRGEGENAKGEVIFFTVSSRTVIPEGTAVSTQPDAAGDFLEYETDEEVVSSDGNTQVSAPITAVEVGEVYNIGSGQITYLPSPPTGVQSVTNTEAILGGADVETNAELRERAKGAIFNTSGGGTAIGVEGYVESNTDNVANVSVAEYPGGNVTLDPNSPSPGGPGDSTATTPFADVIVEGGADEDVINSIETARPVSISHNLVRPNSINIDVDITITGSGINTENVEQAIRNYINSTGLSDDMYRDKVIQVAFNADRNITNIENLDIFVSNEPIEFSSGTDTYALRKGDEMTADGIVSVEGTLNGTQQTTFVEDTDYQEIDTNSDGSPDSIDWSIGGDTPDDGTEYFVSYEVKDDIPISQYEKADTDIVNIIVA